MKTLLTLLALSLAGMLHAQQNPILTGLESFETWKPAESGILPEYWDGFNRNVIVNGRIVGQVNCVEIDSLHPVEGEYTVKLTSKSVLGGAAVPGILTAGKLLIDFDKRTGEVVGGIPTEIMPDRLIGSYKYAPVGLDTAEVSVWFLEKGKRVGEGSLHLQKTTGGWANFTVDITYTAGAKPDSMNITFTTTLRDTLIHAGSVLELDAISFDFNSSVQTYNKKPFSLYPNPASNYITLDTKFEGDAFMQIVDNSGRVQLEWKQTSLTHQIDVSTFKPGLYHLLIINQKNQYRASIIVE